MADIIYPPQGESIPTYATFSDFPATATDGSLATALDTDILYTFNASGSMWIPVGSNVGPSSAYYVNEFILDATDISNKFVTLTAVPANPTLSVLEVIGGPTQRYSSDYTISGSQLNWNGLFLDGVLEVGDQLIVQFY